jgi:hypothetical protein
MSQQNPHQRISLPSIKEMLQLVEKDPIDEGKQFERTNETGTESLQVAPIKNEILERNISVKSDFNGTPLNFDKLYLNFDLKTLKEEKVSVTEHKTKEKKSQWIFEENVLQNRGRKGKQQEWRLGIKKFYKKNTK